MNIGIVDADLIYKKKHRFPNLACMKISSYYKKQGHHVELLMSYNDIENYDKVFISKVFTDTLVPDGITELSFVEYGGTGFFYDKAKPLPYEIEHSIPDYHLYDDFVSKALENGSKKKELEYYTDYSIGFTTRGCIRGCSFCVNKNYKQCVKHSPISEFLDEDRKYICLLDDNILAWKEWKESEEVKAKAESKLKEQEQKQETKSETSTTTSEERSYLDALRKCTVMEAADIYTTGIGKKSDNVFNDGRDTCNTWYSQWGEDDFFEAVYIDWENRKTEEIDGQPLTYYLTILGW